MIALVLGGADCVFDDVSAFQAFGVEPDVVVACNDMIARWDGPLTAACSLHPDKLGGWIVQRHRAGLPEPQFAYADAGKGWQWGYDETPYRFEGQKASGSSGLFALKIALVDLGADRAVLCGIPMEQTQHFFGGHPWGGFRRHRSGWQQAMPQIKDKARSMSGWTKGQLGDPSLRWLSDEAQHA